MRYISTRALPFRASDFASTYAAALSFILPLFARTAMYPYVRVVCSQHARTHLPFSYEEGRAWFGDLLSGASIPAY